MAFPRGFLKIIGFMMNKKNFLRLYDEQKNFAITWSAELKLSALKNSWICNYHISCGNIMKLDCLSKLARFRIIIFPVEIVPSLTVYIKYPMEIELD